MTRPSLDRKDAINRRLYNHQFFVETAIYRVSYLNLLGAILLPNLKPLFQNYERKISQDS
ncbi:hypothetical protein HUN01_07285 [Nostoc edaphicum CCNP1411]|uniref:Uncharacterized protein n=1 Tax=Nostoc edaphicum CCNP1411 TaxID=1472755 RepID=A0A7D7LCB7_9NOSO|nr:hypothetical protein [Nostoc edaphicum]QMS87391.1 hypothetical protein HUN01_07285 [Nostoc edaphicum CCNP1411]